MSTRRSVLPAFDWGRIVRALPGLVGLVDADGRISALGGRLFEEDPDTLELTHLWHLAAEPHRGRLRDALAQAVEEQRDTRVVVRSRRLDEAFAVEIAPDGQGQFVTVWSGLDEDLVEYDTDEVPLEEVGSPPTPRPPELRQPTFSTPPGVRSEEGTSAPVPANGAVTEPRPTPGTPPPPEYVVVAPSNLRRLASRMQRTLDLLTPRTAVWFDDEFDNKANRLTPQSKVLFLGPSKYAEFLRRVVKPSFDNAGACWGTTERKALFWIHDAGTEREVRRALESAANRVAQVSLSRAVRIVGSDDPPSGKELAGKLLLEPTPVRPSLDEERYVLAMAAFLLDGFETFRNGER